MNNLKKGSKNKSKYTKSKSQTIKMIINKLKSSLDWIKLDWIKNKIERYDAIYTVPNS